MPLYRDEKEYTEFRMMQRVVNMFDGNPHMQRMIQYGLLATGMEYEEDLEVLDDYDLEWDTSRNKYHVYPKSSTRLSYTGSDYASALEHPYSSAAKVQAKESDAERKARLLQESKKSKEKAEKKRLKKQRQKERKRLEKKDINPIPDKEKKDITSQTKGEDKSKEKGVKDEASAPDSESSADGSDESSDEENECEGLDLASTFVTKAAQIAKRQMEKKPNQGKKEKKKSPVKEEPKTTPEKLDDDEEESTEKKDTTTCRNLEDNARISTELAMIGNRLASNGEFSMAVKYFTDAIRYNPTEYRLFGNRAFCFEKMQEYEKSLNDAALSLSMFPGWVKGLFRKGRALAGLKRYEEAASAFKEVLKLDSSCTEAAQELMRVQIIQLMEYGFTREQSSNALIIHGTVNKALEVLSKLNKQPEMARNGLVPLQQVANVTGVSPVLSAKASPAAAAHPPQNPETSKTLPENKPLYSVQSQTKPVPNLASASNNVATAPELFPVWVGSLAYNVTETLLTNLFNKVGTVYYVKILAYKRCAFVNFTQQQHCDDAIRQYHGFELMGSKLIVRYPDRIPHGMNISKSAHKAQDDNLRHNLYVSGRTEGGLPLHSSYRSAYKY